MDKWFDDQLKKMELGGNERARIFFESQPDYSSDMTTQEKYHTQAAELYRDKLSAEAEGRPWTPTPSIRSAKASTASRQGGTRSLSNQQRAGSGLSNTQRSNSSISMSGGFGSDSYNNNNHSGTSFGSGDDEGASKKARNEQYFAQLGSANESRPEHLPPNQGGKFTGFGNPQFDDEYAARRNGNSAPSVDIHEIINDPRVAIEKGWSLLSYVGKAAVELGKYANDTYVKPAAAQLADPNFRGQVRDNVSSYVSSLTQPKQNAYGQSSNSYQGFGNDSGSSTPSLRYSGMNSSHTDIPDDDFFNATIHNLQPTEENISGRHTPTSTSNTPPAKNRSSTNSSSVRARANSSTKKKATATHSDDEWGTW
ncbi:ADP-ribosylation factor GTPase-activating protein gcs1, variant 2 [Mucor circinelloides]